MLFTSVVFLFAFLPLVLALYFAVPWRTRNALLLVASLVFYAWGESRMLPLLLLSIGSNFVFGLLVGRATATRRRDRAVFAAVAFNLLILGVAKYANFVADNLNVALDAMGAATVAVRALPLPLGISFFTFHSISYVVDVYRGKAPPQRRFADFALYITLFPQLIAGPIIRYHDIADQLRSRRVTAADLATGIRRFIIGLAKKMLVANTLGEVADRVFGMPATSLTSSAAWLGIVCYAFQIYFDFSGYSDMAIGLCRMLGFRILENFNYPYISQSIQEFWRRWHISLSNWFRDYVYIPLGGNRVSPARTYVNLVSVFFLCGLWHGAAWNFVVWGLFHGAFLVLERTPVGALLGRLWPALRHAYALVVVLVSWVFFRADSLATAVGYLGAMFGAGATPETAIGAAMFLNTGVGTTLLIAAIGATPVPRRLAAALDRRGEEGLVPGTAVRMTRDAALAILLALAASFIAVDTYNPFIYFRF
jgi:alginate O-acetyltransferase complex protein AlgI